MMNNLITFDILIIYFEEQLNKIDEPNLFWGL